MEISKKIPPVLNENVIKAFKKPPAKPVSSVAKGDRVCLSAQARELKAAQEAIKQMGDVDEEKVAKIKARIKAGTYKTDADKAAGNILKESLLKDVS